MTPSSDPWRWPRWLGYFLVLGVILGGRAQGFEMPLSLEAWAETWSAWLHQLEQWVPDFALYLPGVSSRFILLLLLSLPVLSFVLWLLFRPRPHQARRDENGVYSRRDRGLFGVNLSLQIRIFLIAVLIIVSGQIIYAQNSMDSFQRSYMFSVKEKARKMGTLLRGDVEFVLSLGIPLNKLIKVEQTLHEILQATPELEFVEITDLDGYVLYYADHQSMGQVRPGTQLSIQFDPRRTEALRRANLDPSVVDVVLPVISNRAQQQVGYLKMRLSLRLVMAKSREILLDMITVILTSLLITFEFLTFFVSYSISNPLQRVVNDLIHAIRHLTPLNHPASTMMRELYQLIDRFNQFLKIGKQAFHPIFSQQEHLSTVKAQTLDMIRQQRSMIDRFARQPRDISDQASVHKALLQLRDSLTRLQSRFDGFTHYYTAQPFSLLPPEVQRALHEDNRADHANQLPYSYARPMIFLFFMASGFSTSFFPLFVETLYKPLFGLSTEVMQGLPISVFMLFFALVMPLTGSWSDRAGWRAPMLIGILLNGFSLGLTAYAQDIYQLLILRGITGAGFGMVFMSCQRLIVDVTTSRNRAQGMAAFLAALSGGNLVGIVIGGMLADRIGFANVFLVGALFSLMGLLYATLVLQGNSHPEHSSEACKTPVFPLKEMFVMLRDREFFAIVMLQAIPAKIALVGFLFFLVPVYLASLDTLQSDIGRVVMCYGLTMVFLGPLFSKYFHRPSQRKHYIFTGGVITGVSMLSFYYYGGFYPLLGLVIALGIAHTFSISAQVSLISDAQIVRRFGVGTGLGVFRFWERVGNIVGPVLMGFLIQISSPQQAVVWLGTGILCLSLIFFLVMNAQRASREAVETV